MARNNSRKNHSRSRRNKKLDDKMRSGHNIPLELSNSVVLFDQDEFYGMYLDLLLFDFNKQPQSQLVHIETMGDFEMFKQQFTNGEYHNNIYIIDELFGWGEVDIRQLIKNLRIKDEKAHVIGATALDVEDISHANQFDTIVVKSKGGHEFSLTKMLAKIMNVELSFMKDPEFA